MRSSFHRMGWLFSGFLFIFAAYAQADPQLVVKSTSEAMIQELHSNKASLKKDPKIVYNIIHRLLLPHVDIEGMSRSVLGRQVWLGASDSQRAKFVTEFTRLLVRTYAAALATYEDQEVKFNPLREPLSTQNRVQIDSIIIQPDGPQIPVSYRLAKIGEEWKVYDINVDGVSLLQSYRSQFSEQIAHGGLDSLLIKMSSQNKAINNDG
jgi:phospholipid transport system substrate-binding protein